VTADRIDFLIIGAQRSGTTTLHAYLRNHPDVCMGERKELHFFDDRDGSFSTDYRGYHARFHARPGQLRGESTPIYLYWREAMPRIREYGPGLKLVAILRNPIERAFSHWNMERSKQRETLAFWEAITQEGKRFDGQHRIYSYVDRGRYPGQLRHLWEHFPQRQTLILRTDDLASDPQASLGALWTFLGVSPLAVGEAKRKNTQSYAGMAPRERDYLREVFAPEIAELEKMLGWRCGDWLA
jgi:hypothetical protein